MKTHRTIEQVLDHQFHEWELRGRARPEDLHHPVVTVSRLPGSGGRLFAEKLAQELKFDLFDREIVQRIAESANLSEALVRSLDEKVRSRFTEWLLMVERERFFWSHQYLQHLTQVVGVISQHGRAVILGRGSTFILGKGESLRVSIVAPFEQRVHRVARAEQLDEREARRRVIQLESERSAFIKRAFNADMMDPVQYDLVFNTEYFTIDQAVATTRAALQSRGMLVGES